MKTANNIEKDKVRYTLKGQNGQLYVYDDKIEITRKGFFALVYQGLKGTKTIPISEIRSIQVKSCGLTVGYIQFGVSGGVENRGGVQAAHSDENTVTFSNYSANQQAKDIKNYIENIIVKNENQQKNIIQSISNADEIKKYKELLDEGIITQEEFDVKKRQLLGI